MVATLIRHRTTYELQTVTLEHDLPDLRPSAGIDNGGTLTRVAVLVGNRIYYVQFDTRAEEPTPPVLVGRMAEALEFVLGSSGLRMDDLCGIGVSNPGPVWGVHLFDRLVDNTPLGWRMVPLSRMLSNACGGKRVIVENDMTAATVAEGLLGIGRTCDKFLLITVSTGVGAGCWVGKWIPEEFLNEIGHMWVDLRSARECACGSFGCLEAYTSGPHIACQAIESGDFELLEAIAAETGTTIEQLLTWRREAELAGEPLQLRYLQERLPAELIARLPPMITGAQHQNESARQLVMKAATTLGNGIGSYINQVPFHEIKLMGGFALHAGPDYVGSVEVTAQNRFMRRDEVIRVSLTSLGSTIGLVGACVLFKYHGYGGEFQTKLLS